MVTCIEKTSFLSSLVHTALYYTGFCGESKRRTKSLPLRGRWLPEGQTDEVLAIGQKNISMYLYP